MKLFWCVVVAINCFYISNSFSAESCMQLFAEKAALDAQNKIIEDLHKIKIRNSTRLALEQSGYTNLDEIARTVRAVGGTMGIAEATVENYIAAINNESYPANPNYRQMSLKFSFDVIHLLLKYMADWNSFSSLQKLSLRILMYVCLWGNTTPSDQLPLGIREEFKDLVFTVKYRTSLENVFLDPTGQGHMNHFFFGYVYSSFSQTDYAPAWENFKKTSSRKKKAILEQYIDFLKLGYLQPSLSGGAT